MWWLILCVNLSHLKEAQKAGKALCLGVSVKVFLEEISIWTGELSNADGLPQKGWTSPSQSLEVRIEQKGRGKVKSCSPCLIWDVHFLLSSDSGAHGSWAFKLRLTPSVPHSQVFQRGQNYTTGLPGAPSCRSQHCLASIIEGANFCNKSLSLYIWIYIIGFVSLEDSGYATDLKGE